MKLEDELALFRSVLEYNPETGLFVWKETLSFRRTRGKVAGHVLENGYIQIGVKKKLYLAHRLAWMMHYGKWPSRIIDHINGNPSDNRICNLRDVEDHVNSENRRRARSDCESGLIGAMKNKKGWMAKITAKGKKYYLGTFKTPEEANSAYMKAKKELHEGFVK